MDLLVIILIGFVIMWLLVVLPQRRRQAAHQRMLAGLNTGDEVVTAGGLYGRLTGVGDEDVTLEVAPGIEVHVARGAVTGLRKREETSDREDSSDEVTG